MVNFLQIGRGREAVLKVWSDGPESILWRQHNPDIECYNSDFAEFFDDIDSEPIPYREPESNSTTLNSDLLEFLDEIVAPNVDYLNAVEYPMRIESII